MTIEEGTRVLNKIKKVILHVTKIVINMMCPGYETVIHFSDGSSVPLEDLYSYVFRDETHVIFN